MLEQKSILCFVQPTELVCVRLGLFLAFSCNTNLSESKLKCYNHSASTDESTEFINGKIQKP